MKKTDILDERGISWKVLLPAVPAYRVLAMGLDNAQLAGLKRSYDQLDNEPLSDAVYDIIILGKNIARFSHNIQQYLSNIKLGGMVVNLDSFDIIEQLNQSGLKYCRLYAGLPAHQPRLYMPLSSAKCRAKSLNFHKPGSLKAKLALTLAKCLSSLGVKSHLKKDTVSIFASDKQYFNDNCIIGWVSEQIGYEIADLVVYCGSESKRRKITALAIAKDGGNDVVLKLADNQLAIEAIRQETEALQIIAKTPLAVCAPQLIAQGMCGNYFIQIQSQLAIASGQLSSLSEVHFAFLEKLSRINRCQCLLKETSTWKKLNNQLLHCQYLPGKAQAIADYIISEKIANTEVYCHRSHGDFAPWNISLHNSKLLVFDWEDSQIAALPFSDIFHFIYRQAALIGPWPGAVKIIRQMYEYAGRFAILAGISADQIKLSLYIWALNEFIKQPCREIEEMMGSKELAV